MSTGSVSDPEDLQELSITHMDTRSLEDSEDEFSIDDSLKSKTKLRAAGNNNKQQMKMRKDGRQSQRNAASARERARMRVLSKAFSRLKTSLPCVPADTKLSKLDTLRLASSYISHLRQLLQEDRYENILHFCSTIKITRYMGIIQTCIILKYYCITIRYHYCTMV
uniref:Musculin (activated B-cell factor-1) n=1 Tax=Cyprinus carpio TaxID=7962 RepID=A0A8C2BSS8_CYPCA